MKTIRDMLVEVRPFIREAWSLGWPMIMIMFFQFAIGITDVYVAGLLGTDILAAVGYVGQLYWTLIILANAVTVGTVSMASQAHGAESFSSVGSITTHSLILGLVISGLMTAIAGWFPETLVDLAGIPARIQEIARDFVKIFALALIPTYGAIITGGILRSSGRVRIAMISGLIAALLNVAGDVVLGLGWGPFPGMGYRGIAWSSAISVTVGFIINLFYVSQGPERICLQALVEPRPKCFKNLIRLGIPTALQQIAWNAGTLVVYFLVGQLQAGEIIALAALTAGVRIEAIIFLPIFALNMAAAVLTGNRLGVGDVVGARSGAKATALLSFSIIVGPIVAMFVFAPELSSLLNEDPAVVAEMTNYIRINMVAMPFLAVGVALSGALQGAGDTLATMRIIFVGMWLVRIPVMLLIVYVLKWGAIGVWWCMPLSIIILCAMLAYRFLGDTWTSASIDKKYKSMFWEACLIKSSSPMNAAITDGSQID